MGSNSTEKVMTKVNIYVSNINRLLKRVKSEISVDFIQSNKVAATSDLNIVKKYMKDLNSINFNDIMSSRLPQLKSYLKILGILYFVEETNLPISSNIIKSVMKSTYVFNDIVSVSQSHVIKVFPKSNIVVIWVDIEFLKQIKCKNTYQQMLQYQKSHCHDLRHKHKFQSSIV